MDAKTGEARGTNRKNNQQQDDTQRTKRRRQSLRNQQQKRQQNQDAGSKTSDHSPPAISNIESPLPDSTRTSSVNLEDLPTPTLRMVGEFAGERTPFNDCCKRVIEAFNQLHYIINMERSARLFAGCSSEVPGEHMGLQRPEGLSGRSVTRITVEGCTDLKTSGVRIGVVFAFVVAQCLLVVSVVTLRHPLRDFFYYYMNGGKGARSVPICEPSCKADLDRPKYLW